ncbi:maltokinase N-terminal cap-like domain-containing protein [Nocardioides sp. Root151]|uniref:maltokinase N-terminal cap-like domain-containing protein n=1 Tax=Nocardioides sp. Root151 TaxID=1736475 RepID=UPI0007027652|nr:hypothetical protein [Nocardioides sp. Root151]KQZ66420.1 hypothetical protein ASD66_23100 [Nocardioides sp. Root151]
MTVHDHLTAFVESARWFGGKGRAFTVTSTRRTGVLPASDDSPKVAIDLVEVTYDDGDRELYQVPLSFRSEADGRLDHALIGTWTDDDFGDSFVYDAVHDRDAMGQWLSAFAEAGSDASSRRDLLVFHRLPGHDLDLTAHSTLFSGEQSNSSVAFGEDCLMKVFRKVTPGVNPDIQIHHVLTEAGSENVAALYGWLDTVDEASDSIIQLAMLQQFLRTASDGWELAQASVRNLYAEADLHADEVGGDFASESERLGAALAETHQVLAEAFPTEQFAAADVTALGRGMHDRLTDAIEIVPGLADHAPALRAMFDRFGSLGSLTVQRMHGDLHLGQTLRTVKGWKIVDFEGEPAKPLADRLLPDSVWRDVAGMLRSFDYAAAVVERAFRGSDDTGNAQRAYRGEEWTQRNRDAFVTAYAGRDLTDDERLVLAAYEADKAVYECVYEARNRPTWLDIPLAGIARLTA